MKGGFKPRTCTILANEAGNLVSNESEHGERKGCSAKKWKETKMNIRNNDRRSLKVYESAYEQQDSW